MGECVDLNEGLEEGEAGLCVASSSDCGDVAAGGDDIVCAGGGGVAGSASQRSEMSSPELVQPVAVYCSGSSCASYPPNSLCPFVARVVSIPSL